VTEVGEGQGERGVKVVREEESSLLFLHPQICSSSFPQVFSSSISEVSSSSIPLSFFFLHSPSFLFLCFRSYFSTGFVIFPLVEQKKYWVYPLEQIRGLRFRFVSRRHFCFPFWRIFDKVWIFFVTILFKSGSGRSIVENNHSKAESTGFVFPIYVRSSGFVNANLHFSALLSS